MSQVLVTGGGAMAKAVVEALTTDGYAVTRLVETGDGKSVSPSVDFTSDVDIARVVEGLPASFDAVAVCHAYAEAGDLAVTTPTQWRRLLDINLNSTFVLLHAIFDRLAPGASVVLVSSTAGLDRSKNSGPHYTAAKAGINALVRHLAGELAQRQIRINAVCAGLIDDELAASVNTPDSFADAVSGIPLGRAGAPAEIADAVRFLASPDASYVTGAFLTVAGGTHR